MNPEEARYYYYQARNRCDSADEAARRCQNKIDDLESLLNNTKEKLEKAENDLKNAKKRLHDLEKIISHFEKLDQKQIIKADRCSQVADDCYHSAISCSGIMNASVKDSFDTKSVEEDSNSAAALENCRKEKVRLVTEIENLGKNIRSLESDIFECKNTIKRYENHLEDILCDKRRNENIMDEYRRYSNM